MKNQLIAALGCVVLGVGVVSCGQPAPTNTNQAYAVQMMGTIQTVRVAEATPEGIMHLTPYLFVSDNLAEDPLYLQSSTLTLDRFLNQHVMIQGDWSNKDQTILEVKTAEVVPENANSNRGGTRSFSSSNMGVFFNYTAGWTAEESVEDTIEVRDGEEDRLLISIFRIPASKTENFDRWVARNYAGLEPAEYQVGLLVGRKVTKASQDILLVNDNASYYTLVFNTEVQGMNTQELLRGYGELQSSLRFFTPGETAETTNSNGVIPSSDTATSNANTNAAAVPLTEDGASVVQYILANQEAIVGSAGQVSEVEVAGENHVYVTYKENDLRKKVLLEYKASGNTYTTTPIANFEEGGSTTWVKVSGTNVAANEAREIYKVDAGTAVKTTQVQPGMNVYDNSQLQFQVQYPRSWYFRGESLKDEGGLQKVTFSDKPLEEDPTQRIELKVYPKGYVDLSQATKTTLGGKEAFLLEDGAGGMQYAVQGTDGRLYMSATLQDNANKQVVADILGSLSTK